MDCQFCKILGEKGEKIIQETEHSFTVLSDPKLMDGHLLVIPKRHIEKLSDLSQEEKQDLFDEVMNLQEKILNTLAPGCDICQNYRPFIPGDKLVNHLHIHLRPRSLDDELFIKVQINENQIFKHVEPGEWEEYKKLLRD
ncbi:MAG: HIT family protein [Patescibacteria group bacterium]